MLNLRMLATWSTFLVMCGCSTSTFQCPSPDDPAPFAAAPESEITGSQPQLSAVSTICVSAEDYDSKNDFTPQLIWQLESAGVEPSRLQTCQVSTVSSASIQLQTMVSACVDCGDCLTGPRYGIGNFRVRNHGQAVFEFRWSDRQGGTVSEILQRFAAAVAKLLKRMPGAA